MAEEFPHYIEFRHVFKTFDKPVLVDSNFSVDAGQTVAIIGRSGVGKSVTLAHIMGFLKPDQGRVIVAHEDITDFSEAELRKVRKKVTMVFQSGALFDSLTVGENVLFSLELREDYDEQNKEDVVNGLLQIVDILDYKDAYPTDLSTGYKRAVAIARALAAQPQCILYDEPTTMVDPIMSTHLSDLMLRLKDKLRLTAVVVTHDLELMRKVADLVVFLHEGQVIFFGPTGDLEHSDHPFIQEFLEWIGSSLQSVRNGSYGKFAHCDCPDPNPDEGRVLVTKDPKDWGVFKTPTLREVEHTTPYMHDGSLKTPDDVVEKLNLTDSEKSELVAFLKALSGDGRQQIKAPLAFPQ